MKVRVMTGTPGPVRLTASGNPGSRHELGSTGAAPARGRRRQRSGTGHSLLTGSVGCEHKFVSYAESTSSWCE
ncbi:hypothetical protein ACFFX0_18165 [Citricoccus parietis]|uniref:Uncharacterized protein n=1 Tax=Citricoccus parietis TaxID=592307 RepID=A0ABV5G263_9MICC